MNYSRRGSQDEGEGKFVVLALLLYDEEIDGQAIKEFHRSFIFENVQQGRCRYDRTIISCFHRQHFSTAIENKSTTVDI